MGLKGGMIPTFNPTLKLALTPLQDQWIRLLLYLLFLSSRSSNQIVEIEESDGDGEEEGPGEILPESLHWVGSTVVYLLVSIVQVQ